MLCLLSFALHTKSWLRDHTALRVLALHDTSVVTARKVALFHSYQDTALSDACTSTLLSLSTNVRFARPNHYYKHAYENLLLSRRSVHVQTEREDLTLHIAAVLSAPFTANSSAFAPSADGFWSFESH